MTVLVTHHPSLPPGAPPMPAPTRSPRSRPHGAPACCLARLRLRVDHRPAPPAGPGTVGRQRRGVPARKTSGEPACSLVGACCPPGVRRAGGGRAGPGRGRNVGRAVRRRASRPSRELHPIRDHGYLHVHDGWEEPVHGAAGVNSITATAVGAQGGSGFATPDVPGGVGVTDDGTTGPALTAAGQSRTGEGR